MEYTNKNYEHILGLPGFGDTLLKNHFTLYQGYVTNTNKLMKIISDMIKEGKQATPEFAEIKRRFGWEFNGMRLHELYFENMTKNASQISKSSKIYQLIEKNFGNYENFEKEFKATGVMRGIGWVIVYHDKQNDNLFIEWVNEHEAGHLSTATPLLIMDVFEHAFMIEYGLKRADYIESFVKAIDWNIVEKRIN